MRQKFNQTTAPAPLDASDLLIFTQMHSDDGRLLSAGWWNVGLSCLTLTGDTHDKELQRLQVIPVAEFAQLRGESLGEHTRSTSIASAKLGLWRCLKAAKVQHRLTLRWMWRSHRAQAVARLSLNCRFLPPARNAEVA